MRDDFSEESGGKIAQDLRRNLLDGDPDEGGYEEGRTAYDLNKENYDLSRDRDNWRELAKIDPLTGLKNRYELREVQKRLEESDEKFTVFMLDLDHFKTINDTYGHEIGDETLKHISEKLRELFRSTDGDTLIRYGGEEFLVIMNLDDDEIAKKRAEMLRHAIETAKFSADKTDRTKTFPATTSIGISMGKGRDLENIIGQADKALYKAKVGDGKENKGRNQWVFYDEALERTPRQGTDNDE